MVKCTTVLKQKPIFNTTMKKKNKFSVVFTILHINVEVRAAYSFFKKYCFLDRKYSMYYWFWITHSPEQKFMLLFRKSTLNGVSNRDMFCFRVCQCYFKAFLCCFRPYLCWFKACLFCFRERSVTNRDILFRKSSL